jgi:hypothetical protein
MTSMTLRCEGDATFGNHISATGFQVNGASQVTTIMPHGSVEYLCPLRKGFTVDTPLQTISIEIAGTFGTMWWRRTFISPPFSWDDVGRVWAEGTPVN